MFDRIIIIIIMMPAKPWKQFLQHVGYHFSQEARSQPCKRRQWSQPRQASGESYGNNGTENHLVNIVGIYNGVKAGVEVIEEVHHLHMIAELVIIVGWAK